MNDATLTTDDQTQRPKVGEYWMHCMHGRGDGTLVKISDETDTGRFGIHYVQIVGERDGVPRVISGGGSFYWNVEEFKPVTEPCLLAAAKVYEARERLKVLKQKALQAEADEAKWQGVLETLFEARKATR